MVRRWPMRQPFFGARRCPELAGHVPAVVHDAATGPASSCAHREGRATGASIRRPPLPAFRPASSAARWQLHGLRAASADRPSTVGPAASGAFARAPARPERRGAGTRRPHPGERVRLYAVGGAEPRERRTGDRARRSALGELPRGGGAGRAAPDPCAARRLGACRSRGSGFDVGSVFAEYLRAWVGSVPIVGAGRSGPARRPRTPSAGFDAAGHARILVGVPIGSLFTVGRVVELGAVRLLQTAVERAQGLVPLRARRDPGAARGQHAQQPDARRCALLGLRP